MGIPYLIDNHVGKRNTMYVVKWFVERTKQLVQAHRAKKMSTEVYWWLESWRNAWEWREQQAAEEQLRQEAEANEREYLRQRKEEDERTAQREKEILEEKRLKRLLDDDATEAYFEKKYPRCPDCGLRSPHCSCDE